MKLIITRTQRETPNGMSFVSVCRVQFTEEESSLILRYHPPMDFPPGTDNRQEVPQGERAILITFEDTDVRNVSTHEQEMREACEDLSDYLREARSFTGTQEFEFETGEE